MRRAVALLCAPAILIGCTDEADSAAAAVGPPAAEPAAGADFTQILAFKDPATCEWSDAADAIFRQAVDFVDEGAASPGAVPVPGLDEEVAARLSHPDPAWPDYTQTDIDATGRWLGLDVVGLTDAFVERGGGVFGRGVRFASPRAEVIETLRAEGFPVNEDGSPSNRPLSGPDYEEGDEVFTNVQERDGETVFLCNLVYSY